jgi:hypothetical protein
MTIRLLYLLLLTSLSALAQQPPGTEIYWAELRETPSGLRIGRSINLTRRPGYDNQPFFHPTEDRLYYASADADQRTDIASYDFGSSRTTYLTRTPEREYSPTVTPDGRFISCIIQRDQGAQDLGRYPVTGGKAEVLIANLIVGYHAWLDERQLILFVLGQPNTLRSYALTERMDRVIQTNVGRSLHKIPSESSVSFVDKSTPEWMIKKIKADGTVEAVCPTLPGREDLAWTPAGNIVMSDGTQLYYRHPGKDTAWKPLKGPKNSVLKGISRLAINAQGTKIALVVNE